MENQQFIIGDPVENHELLPGSCEGLGEGRDREAGQ